MLGVSAIALDPLIAEARERAKHRRFFALGAVVLAVMVPVGATVAVWANAGSDVPSGVPSSPVYALSTGGGETWVMTGPPKSQQLWSSANGDHKWLRVTPPLANGTDLGDSQVVDPLHGWVVINNGDGYDTLRGIARTTDGGRAWQTSAPPGCSTCTRGSLTFVDAEHGYLSVYTDPSAEATKFFSTSDGGVTWRLGPRSGRAADATWVDAQHAIYDEAPSSPGGYVGEDRFFRTSDGGHTWTPAALGGTRAFQGLVGGVTSVGGALVVPAELWTSSQFVNRPVVYTSSDGGAHWQEHSAPSRAFLADGGLGPRGALFSAASPDTWVLSDANHRHLFETTDGGKTWRASTLPRSFRDAQEIDFTSAAVGWAILASGQLVHTTDGGRHWALASRPEPKVHKR